MGSIYVYVVAQMWNTCGISILGFCFIIIVLVWQRLLLGFKGCLETRGNQMIGRQRLSSYLGFSSIGKVFGYFIDPCRTGTRREG